MTACELTAAAAESMSNTACDSLQHIELWGLDGAPASRTDQLHQLAGLPSLSSVNLQDSSCPTLFLNSLTTRLTTLHLDSSCRKSQPDGRTTAPEWQATLRHVARCTALLSLTIPCSTSGELGVVAPALRQLQRLHLTGPGAAAGEDGDGMVELLVGLPHLTRLRWDNAYGHTFQRSCAGRACNWKELGFTTVSLALLARLPLRSLDSPVPWDTLVVDASVTVAEARAAAHNATRACTAGVQWPTRALNWCRASLSFRPPQGSSTFTQGAGEGDTPAALLRALQPLLAAPSLLKLAVSDLTWDGEAATALGQALNRSCDVLAFENGSLTAAACVQLAKSVPWLGHLSSETCAFRRMP